MPLKEDYVHDAVMHIRQGIAKLENHDNIISALAPVEMAAECAVSANERRVARILGEIRFKQDIPILKGCIESLYESISYNPSTDSNQLNINFDGE